MYIKIHRGSAQIGGNIIELATEKTRIVLDCGTNLPPLDGEKPDDNIEIDGLTRGESLFDGVFVTHYHADHCGLMGRVNGDIPVYSGSATKDVLNVIADFIDAPLPRISQTLEHGREVVVGDMKILPLSVGHSAYGAMMFLIEGGGKMVLYTGDFNRIDEAYYSFLGELDLTLCEGTNVGRRNGLTDKDVERDAAKIMRETGGQAFVLCSTTNIDRIKSIENACRKSGRTIAIDPFMRAVTDRISNLLLVDPVGFVPYYISKDKNPREYKYLSEDFQQFNNAETVAKMTNLTFMVRQTMGKFLANLDKVKPLSG